MTTNVYYLFIYNKTPSRNMFNEFQNKQSQELHTFICTINYGIKESQQVYADAVSSYNILGGHGRPP